MQNNFTSLNGSIHSLFNQRFSFKHLAALVASVLVILCAVWLPYALFWQLDGLLSLQQAQILGSCMFYGGIASFIVVAVVTRFRLSKDWSLKRNVGLFSILLSTTLVFSSLLSAPVVAALTPLPSDTGPNNSSAFKFSVPFTEYQWVVAQFRDGTYYAINGSDWNIMTIVEPWQPVAPWAALAENKTALVEQVLSVTGPGKVLLNELSFDYALTVPENVTVVESLNGLTRSFINEANSQGSPYTISVDTVQTGYYLAQDSAGRFIDSWSSTNQTLVLSNAIAVLPNGTGVIVDKSDGTVITRHYDNSIEVLTLNSDGTIISLDSVTQLKEQYLENYQMMWDEIEIFDSFELSSVWNDGGSLDATSKLVGNASLQVTSAGSLASATRTCTLNMTNKAISFWVNVDDVDKLNTFSISFQTKNSWSHFHRYVISSTDTRLVAASGEWIHIIIPPYLILQSPTGTPDLGNVTAIRFNVSSKVNQTVSVNFDDLRIWKQNVPAKITLRFDDGRDFTYQAKEIMDKYGFKGVAAVIPSKIDTSGYMTLSQLTEMDTQGWDIVSHSYTHPGTPDFLLSLTRQQQELEVVKAQRWLIEQGFIRGSVFFVPPGNTYDKELLDIISEYNVFTSTYPYWIFGTLPFAQQLGVCYDADRISVENIKTRIDQTVTYGSHLTLFFHEYAAGLTDFEEILAYIADSNIEVVTFSDLFTGNVDKGETFGIETITDSTTVTFNHNMAAVPTHVELGFKTVGYGESSWIANSTHITVTVANSGSYSFSWRAYYYP